LKKAIVSGGFDDLRLSHICLLHAASKRGPLEVLLWSDELIASLTGEPSKFSEAERQYLLESIRYVDRVTTISDTAWDDALPEAIAAPPAVWVADDAGHSIEKRAFCRERGLEYHHLDAKELAACLDTQAEAIDSNSANKRVLVTGCFDWFHSGHVRFFEEAAELGDLYVVVGHDANIRHLKGEGHPLFPENQRRFMVQAVRFVKRALISTGLGWLDAEPEIERIEPQIYAVNEDGDRPEKRLYCEKHGIEYRVLKRLPKAGLPPRQSTYLRGY
jgi:cytidyltransferase-like protein